MNLNNRLASKIGLGGAQFGQPYGVQNLDSLRSELDLEQVLKVARRNDIHLIDTASSYGSSEVKLGNAGIEGFDVVTKIPLPDIGNNDLYKWIVNSVEQSCDKLGVSSLYGLLLHEPLQLLKFANSSTFTIFDRVRDSGLVQRIGISIYSPSDLEQIGNFMHYDIVQAPFNVFDTRIRDSGWLERLKAIGTEFHSRSVFLQGLLLQAAEQRHSYFDRWDEIFDKWEAWLAHHQLTALQACLRFVLDEDAVDRVIVGIDNSRDLIEILDAVSQTPKGIEPSFVINDIDLIDPRNWRLQ